MENPLKLEDLGHSVTSTPEYLKARQMYMGASMPGADVATSLFKFRLLKGSTRHFVHLWLLWVKEAHGIDFSCHPVLEASLKTSYALIYGPQTPESRLQISMSFSTDLVSRAINHKLHTYGLSYVMK